MVDAHEFGFIGILLVKAIPVNCGPEGFSRSNLVLSPYDSLRERWDKGLSTVAISWREMIATPPSPSHACVSGLWPKPSCSMVMPKPSDNGQKN